MYELIEKNVCENSLKEYKALSKFQTPLGHYPYYCSGVLGMRKCFSFFMFSIVPNKEGYKGHFPIVFCMNSFGEVRPVQWSVLEAPAKSTPRYGHSGVTRPWGEGSSQMFHWHSGNCCVSLIKLGSFPTYFPKRILPMLILGSKRDAKFSVFASL